MSFFTLLALITILLFVLALGALAAIGVALITTLKVLGYLLIAAIAFLLIYAACFWIKVGYHKIMTRIHKS